MSTEWVIKVQSVCTRGMEQNTAWMVTEYVWLNWFCRLLLWNYKFFHNLGLQIIDKIITFNPIGDSHWVITPLPIATHVIEEFSRILRKEIHIYKYISTKNVLNKILSLLLLLILLFILMVKRFIVTKIDNDDCVQMFRPFSFLVSSLARIRLVFPPWHIPCWTSGLTFSSIQFSV